VTSYSCLPFVCRLSPQIAALPRRLFRLKALSQPDARFVLEAAGITADEAALALSAAKGLAGLKTRDVAAETLRRLAKEYGMAL
jgi:hypothetical protein